MSTSSNLADKFGREPGQQTVVVQCRHDVVNMRHRNSVPESDLDNYFCHDTNATYDQAINRIDRGNLVFQVGDSRFRGTILDNALPVVDQVNGMKRKKHRDERKIKNDKFKGRRLANRLADDIKVIGVTLGATVPNPEEEKDQKNQITVRVHGTTNIFNNSGTTIKPGDTLIWEVPLKDEDEVYSDRYPLGVGRNARNPGSTARLPQPPRYGRAATKYTLRVKPLRTMDLTFYEDAITSVMKADKHRKYNAALVSKSAEFALKLKKFAAKIHFMSTKTNGAWDQNARNAFEKHWEDNIEKRTEPGHDNTNDLGFHKLMATLFKEDPDVMNEVMLSFLQIQLDIRSRTLGKAFNYAKSGEMIGALLGVA
jgi:hypothetical protein